MRAPLFVMAMFGSVALLLSGCTTPPSAGPDRTQLNDDGNAALNDFKTQDPSLNDIVRGAYGYAIFPSVGTAAAGVGGAYGQGVVYQQGNRVGYAELNQATVGAALGGATYSELIVFHDAQALQRFQAGQYTFAGDLSAVIVKAGVAAEVKWTNGVSVFVYDKGGLMASLSVGGQKFDYHPM